MKLKFNKLLIYIIQALFTSLAFSTATRAISPEEVLSITTSNNIFIVNLAKLQLNYSNGYGVSISIILFLLVFFYYHIDSIKIPLNKRLKVISYIGGIIFSTFMIIGNIFLYGSNILLVNIINFLGYFFLFKNLFIFIISHIKKDYDYKNNILKKQHPIIFFMIFLLICWLPYIIIFFPGTMNVDSLYEIEQFLGKIEWTTHHPIFPTIVYGLFMKLGMLFSNDKLGLFFNNITQVIFASWILSYCINYISSLINNKKVIYAVVAFFAFFPIWPIHFYTEVKDIWFSLSFLLFTLFSIKFINADGKLSKKEWCIYILSMILVYLFRNNGVFIVLLSFPFLALVVKRVEKIKIVAFSVLSIVICTFFTNIFMSCFNIKKGSIAEALSIPLQQTSHYAHNYELTEEESSAISKIIDINDLKENYLPETVDLVKLHFKKESSFDDLKDYFIIWFKMFFKHPLIYFKATLNSTYGYFYPNRIEYKDGVAQFSIDDAENINVSNFDLQFPSETQGLRNFVERFIYMLRNMPFIGLFFSCGLYTWILIACTLILIYFKKYKELTGMVPLYIVLLVCIASPVNAFVRYMLPIMLTLPFILCWSFYKIKS